MVNVTIICGGQTDKQKGQKLYTSDHRNLTFYSENIRMIKCEKIFPSIYKETKGMQRLDYLPLYQDALQYPTKITTKKRAITISFTLATDNTKLYL